MIERAEGTDLIDAEGRRYLDGVCSLWCNVHGHRHPRARRGGPRAARPGRALDDARADPPGAAELAARLVEIAPPGLTRVFFSDAGSTAIEIALKMAFQYWQQRGGQPCGEPRFVALGDAYHGDTIGRSPSAASTASTPIFRPLLFEAHAAEPGDAADLERLLAAHEGEIAAVIVEPLVQGAAGMIVHPPGLPARGPRALRPHGVLLIADEVAVGFGRTGTMFACEQEGVTPDFLCLAKGLTGGYLPLAATLTTERIYDAFLGAAEEQHLLPRPHLHRQPARLRGGARQPRGLRAASGRCSACSRRSGSSASCSTRSRRWPRSPRSAAAGSWSAIDLGEHDPALRIGHRVTLEARERGAIIRPLGDVDRADAAAGDLQGRPAAAGRDHRGLDRRSAAPSDHAGA